LLALRPLTAHVDMTSTVKGHGDARIAGAVRSSVLSFFMGVARATGKRRSL